MNQTLYQVSTLQTLALGYTRPIITVRELLQHGDSGLGTFENVDGEMIVADGHCYRANEKGSVQEMPPETGVSFASVTFLQQERREKLAEITDIESLKSLLTVKIEERFGLNSMHIVRINGFFEEVRARAESGFQSQHVTLKDILSKTQKDFVFQKLSGSLIGVYFPDYMDGINMPGWHLHFVSEDKTKGGHVFDLHMTNGEAIIDKIQCLTIQLPTDPAFDTYALKEASHAEIKQVEQGK